MSGKQIHMLHVYEPNMEIFLFFKLKLHSHITQKHMQTLILNAEALQCQTNEGD